MIVNRSTYDMQKESAPMPEPDDASRDAELVCERAGKVAGVEVDEVVIADGKLDFITLQLNCDVEDAPERLEAFANVWWAVMQRSIE